MNEDAWPRGEETFHTIPYVGTGFYIVFGFCVILIVLMFWFLKRKK